MNPPPQDYIFKTLADSRFNKVEVCKQAGISYKKILPYIAGKRKKQLPEGELGRLWESMQILEKKN